MKRFINQLIHFKSGKGKGVMNQKRMVVFFMFIVLFLSGCHLFFQPEEQKIAQLKNSSDYENAISGVYGLLTRAMNNDMSFYVNVKGDDLYNLSPIYNEFFKAVDDLCKGKKSYNDRNYLYFESTWSDFYTLIISLNNLLVQYSKQENKDEKIKEIAGEAYLVRAYCYLRLSRTYGQIPLVADIDVDYSVAKSPFIEIYEFIENDLILAQQLLPENSCSARIPMVTPHKGTAKSILAELYLSWAGYPLKDLTKYVLAANTAKEVIDSADQYGMGLLDDFAKLWERKNLYNKESVFCIYFPPQLDMSQYNGNYLFLGSSFVFGSYSEPRSVYSGLGFWGVESTFYNNYPKNYRRDITFFNYVYDFKWISNEEGYEKIYAYIEKLSPCSRIGYRKFFYDLKVDTIHSEYGSRIYYYGSQRLDLFRFAHTLLTYAEASARSGHLDEKAYECVNMIRRRANHLDIHTPSAFDLQQGMSPETFADSVILERAWELAGEPEGRWFDLVRLEMVEDLPQLRNTTTGDFPDNNIITKKDYYFPIPKEDIILNPALGD